MLELELVLKKGRKTTTEFITLADTKFNYTNNNKKKTNYTNNREVKQMEISISGRE